MTRSAARRTSAVQEEKPSQPIPTDASSVEPREPPLPTSTTPWYWRLVLFLWVTSFAFLWLYELLAGIIKAVKTKN